MGYESNQLGVGRIVFFFGAATAMAWDANKRLAYFVAAQQVAALCNRADMYKDLSNRYVVEYRQTIDAIYGEGLAHGLSDVDAKALVVQTVHIAKQKVASDYMPDLLEDKERTCRTIYRRFVVFRKLIEAN